MTVRQKSCLHLPRLKCPKMYDKISCKFNKEMESRNLKIQFGVTHGKTNPFRGVQKVSYIPASLSLSLSLSLSHSSLFQFEQRMLHPSQIFFKPSEFLLLFINSFINYATV